MNKVRDAASAEPLNNATHLGGDEHDVDVLTEGGALGVHDAEEESVGEAEGGAGLHRGEDARVELRLRGVGDEEHDEVGLGDDVEGLAET